MLDGAELSYFGQEGLSEVVVSQPSAAVTFQFQCSAESTNVSNNISLFAATFSCGCQGTGVQGGQIPEIIFYGPSPM